MSGTRRAHRKSRSGCTECKRRRIKCGEEKPRCSHCVRHEKVCEYTQPTAVSGLSPSGRSTLQVDSSTASVEANSPSAVSVLSMPTSSAHLPSSLFDMKDMALLHHWCLVTSTSIINARKLDYLWQTLLPQVGFGHPHVMHSILSLTALHIAYLNPSNKSSSILDAAQHHSKALEGFKEGINCPTPENSDALFANAALTFFYAFLMFGKLYDDDSGNRDSPAARTARILGAGWIPLVRGLEAVLHPTFDHVRIGPLKDMLSNGNWGELNLNNSTDPYDEEILRIREVWHQKEDADVYNEALNNLRTCRMFIAQFDVLEVDYPPEWGLNRGWAGPFIWVFVVKQKFFDLLEQRQPPALLVFAWFGATLHSLDKYWWMEGCGKGIVNVVGECLGSYWDPWMVCAKNIVGSG
ncbi:hypothetical protein B0J11DRAFT_16624 [Dendryphion nanum]|uniref:Zn(2)-C6 fungal-type domain-containing protein n=1 Tax=Dendryphion nanum TaxID=256645 RepID=A0A9P9EJ88_9PLEO|nr:hypothetical protein B0J11DRAFT_16624 [Dendryphion nanum]